MTTESVSVDTVIREWFLVKVSGMSYDEKVEFAKDIYCKVNSPEKVKKCSDCKGKESNKEKWAKKEKVIVVRADLLEDNKNNYDIVVPVYAESEDDLDKISKAIQWLAVKPNIVEIDRLRVAEHIPHTPHNAHGYVTAEEANPLPKGPIDKDDGHNPW